MRLNPIVKKDIKVQARSMKMAWGIFAYEAILAGVFFIALLFISNQSIYDDSNIYSKIVWLYPVLAIAQIIIIAIVIPVQTSSAISGEKERQTFDIMMTTSMTPFSIIMGKVGIAMVQGLFFIVASLPVMALTFVIGGMSWSYLFWFFAMALLVSFFAASIGILCSSLCKKTISGVIFSYGIYACFFVLTAVPYFVWEVVCGYQTTASSWSLLMLANPFVYLAEFVELTMTGSSLIEGSGWLYASNTKKGFMHWLGTGNHWMIVSTIVYILISLLFLWIAAKRITPISHRKAKELVDGRNNVPETKN